MGTIGPYTWSSLTIPDDFNSDENTSPGILNLVNPNRTSFSSYTAEIKYSLPPLAEYCDIFISILQYLGF
jgi:hypothetical protein